MNKNKPSINLFSLFFTLILKTVISFFFRLYRAERKSPEPAEAPANSGVISTDNLINIEWQWAGFEQSGSPENEIVVQDPKITRLLSCLTARVVSKPVAMVVLGTILTSAKSAAFENKQLILYFENAGQKVFFINDGKAEKKV